MLLLVSFFQVSHNETTLPLFTDNKRTHDVNETRHSAASVDAKLSDQIHTLSYHNINHRSASHSLVTTTVETGSHISVD